MSTVKTPKLISTNGESKCREEFVTLKMGRQEFFGKTTKFGADGACQSGSGHLASNQYSPMAVVQTRSSPIQSESGETQLLHSTTKYQNTSNNLFHQVRTKL